jgi:invasion protein IalB
MTMLIHKRLFSASILALGLTAYAYAQTPQRTTAVYGDWTVLCVMPSNPDDKKACAMVQSNTVQGQTTPAGQITISQSTKNEPVKLFLQVPANVSFQGGVVSFVTDQSEPLLAATFRWCIPARCMADADLTNADLTKLRAQKKPGRIAYKNASQADVSIPMSFNGFSDAFDALQKQ